MTETDPKAAGAEPAATPQPVTELETDALDTVAGGVVHLSNLPPQIFPQIGLGQPGNMTFGIPVCCE